MHAGSVMPCRPPSRHGQSDTPLTSKTGTRRLVSATQDRQKLGLEADQAIVDRVKEE